VRVNTEAIAKRLVELCREGKYEDAQRELYAEDAQSIEPEGLPPGALGSVQGLSAIYEKGRQFNAMIEAVHGGSVSEPVIADNWFSIALAMDVTMKGRGRMNMSEICVYRVRDGKIVREQFFYDVG
jgi:ketosteroid isomerase-like protein